MTDQVSVVARKPFEYGGKTRTPKSGPFSADRSVAEQLERIGLLKVLGPTASAVGSRPERKKRPPKPSNSK